MRYALLCLVTAVVSCTPVNRAPDPPIKEPPAALTITTPQPDRKPPEPPRTTLEKVERLQGQLEWLDKRLPPTPHTEGSPL